MKTFKISLKREEPYGNIYFFVRHREANEAMRRAEWERLNAQVHLKGIWTVREILEI